MYGGWHAGVSVSLEFQSWISGAFTISHGWIWNLWNTYDYTNGPFWSGSVGAGSLGGATLFKDANDSFDKGPFGVSFPALILPPSASLSLSLAKTWYRDQFFYERAATFGMGEVAIAFTTEKMLLAGLAAVSGNPVGLLYALYAEGIFFRVCHILSKKFPHARMCA